MTADRVAPVVCVGAVALHDDRLLMVRRARPPGRGLWSVPGGRVEPGETLAQAVVRELEEETALEGVCGALVGWVERIDPDHHFVILDFSVEVLDPSPVRAGDDADEAEWVPVTDVATRPLVGGLAAFLHHHGVIPTIV
jgi:ADP-ribose pyrophosphatase YjhB (NUDIX family)